MLICAVLAFLFRAHRVLPLLQGRGDAESGRKLVLRVCEGSEHVLVLLMRDGDSITCISHAQEVHL